MDKWKIQRLKCVFGKHYSKTHLGKEYCFVCGKTLNDIE